jgi:hypothetical protein
LKSTAEESEVCRSKASLRFYMVPLSAQYTLNLY